MSFSFLTQQTMPATKYVNIELEKHEFYQSKV